MGARSATLQHSAVEDTMLLQTPSFASHRQGPVLSPMQGVDDMTDIIAMILLPVAVLMCAYAMVVFLWRGSQIARKQV